PGTASSARDAINAGSSSSKNAGVPTSRTSALVRVRTSSVVISNPHPTGGAAESVAASAPRPPPASAGCQPVDHQPADLVAPEREEVGDQVVTAAHEQVDLHRETVAVDEVRPGGRTEIGNGEGPAVEVSDRRRAAVARPTGDELCVVREARLHRVGV